MNNHQTQNLISDSALFPTSNLLNAGILTILLSMITPIAYAAKISAEGWYIGGRLGFSLAPNMTSQTTITTIDGAAITPPVVYNGGVNTGTHIGFKDGPFRYEGQFFFNHNDIDSINIDGVPNNPALADEIRFSGRTQTYAAMLNIYYDVFESDVTNQQRNIVPVPYLGAGIGYAWVNNRLNFNGPDLTAIAPFKPSEQRFAFQAIAGLSLYLDSVTSVFFDYRYFTTAELSAFNSHLQLHTFNIGANFLFDIT